MEGILFLSGFPNLPAKKKKVFWPIAIDFSRDIFHSFTLLNLSMKPFQLSFRAVLTWLSFLALEACFAFMGNPSRRSFATCAKGRYDNDNHSYSSSGIDHHPTDHSPADSKRRKLLALIPAVPLVASLESASAQVVADAPAPQINTAQKTASSRVLCADLEEGNRIAIFERVAPSVVYIDTFAEKRDVFSTNV